jgi:competence protein ComFC
MSYRVVGHSVSAVSKQTRTAFTFLLDLLFPPFCISCKTLGQRLCDSCAGAIDWIDAGFCPQCGLPSKAGFSHRCIDSSKLLFIRSAAVFSGVMRKALHSLKYYSDRILADRLISLAYGHWCLPAWEFDLLLPVPLGKIREERRGFNQSLLLAESLSRIVGIPVDFSSLARIRETPTQVGLSVQARKDNVSNAFQAGSVKGRKLLLVDDVCTTGATLQSCAEALIEAGASRVGALTLARAVLPNTREKSSNPIPTGGQR